MFKLYDVVCDKAHTVVGVICDRHKEQNTIVVLWNKVPEYQGCKTVILHNDVIELLPKGTIIRELHNNGKYLECEYDHYDHKKGMIYGKFNNLIILGGEKYDIIFEDDEVTTKNDAVNHPSHYTQGKIEVIEYIEDKKLGYHLGNVVKYVSRAGHKNNALEDLKKARWYLNREIENREARGESI